MNIRYVVLLTSAHDESLILPQIAGGLTQPKLHEHRLQADRQKEYLQNRDPANTYEVAVLVW